MELNDFSKETGRFLPHKYTVNESTQSSGCCRSKHTWNCCFLIGIIGGLFLLMGIALMFAGATILEHKILKTMAISPGSDRFKSWLVPPVQPYLTAYAFHLKNPDDVLKGHKPLLEERGPYVYKSVTIKDSDDNLNWNSDNDLLTYRPRKLYTFMPEMSGGKNPDTEYITVPNVPLWTALNQLRLQGKMSMKLAVNLVTTNGLGTPFINVSFSGLLWGYQDDLPCLKLEKPEECPSDDPFSSGIGGGDDDDDWKRKRRSINENEISYYDTLSRPKAEYVNCTCNWGLFRDRNVTMRKSIKFYTGISDLTLKGLVASYDGKNELNWWKKGSSCDAVGGQDSSTLPPSLTPHHKLDIFIALMCRKLRLTYEKEEIHAGIRSLRFVPPENALGAHDDPNAHMANPDNACYCLNKEGFRCFKSGVLNMRPCKRDTNAPLALSMPHFYQADASFREAVSGMNPNKEKHQFFIDVVPEFGFPLAIRPRFQLNLVLRQSKHWEPISKMRSEIVLPFLWAQDGFDEPSEEMAKAIQWGLEAPTKLSLYGSSLCLVLGSVFVLLALSYFVWRRRNPSQSGTKGVSLNNM